MYISVSVLILHFTVRHIRNMFRFIWWCFQIIQKRKFISHVGIWERFGWNKTVSVIMKKFQDEGWTKLALIRYGTECDENHAWHELCLATNLECFCFIFEMKDIPYVSWRWFWNGLQYLSCVQQQHILQKSSGLWVLCAIPDFKQTAFFGRHWFYSHKFSEQNLNFKRLHKDTGTTNNNRNRFC